MGSLYRTALVIAIIGAVNWGLIGFFQFDLVASLFGGADSVLSRIIYAVVGIAGLVCIPLLAKPLDESEASTTSTASTSQPTYNNPSYQTEFAEEDEFSDSDSFHSKRNYNNSKGDSSYKKDK
ncbi:MAG: DUF378 domain-containing protein [Lysinibacillus sp.]